MEGESPIWKCKFYRLVVRKRASGYLQISPKSKHDNGSTVCRHDVIVNCFVFLSSFVTGPSFMSISLLVLELWQFSFIRDWPEIWKSEIHPVAGYWSMMKMPNFANFSNKMLLNVAKYQGYSIYHFWVTKGKKKRYFDSQFEFFILAYSDKLNPAAIFRSETYQFWGKAVT